MEQMPTRKEAVFSIIRQFLLAFVIVFGSATAALILSGKLNQDEGARADAIVRENTRAANCTEPLKEGQLAFPDCRPGEAGYKPVIK